MNPPHDPVRDRPRPRRPALAVPLCAPLLAGPGRASAAGYDGRYCPPGGRGFERYRRRELAGAVSWPAPDCPDLATAPSLRDDPAQSMNGKGHRQWRVEVLPAVALNGRV